MILNGTEGEKQKMEVYGKSATDIAFNVLTALQVRALDVFSRVMAQTMWNDTRVCLWGLVDIAPHLGGEIP